MEQEVIALIQANPQVVSKIADRIYHEHIDSGDVYPAVAFAVDIMESGVCVDGSTYKGQLTIMIETRSMEELTYLRKHMVKAIHADKNFRFETASPNMESTSKKRYLEMYFRIIRIDEP